ncbi:uncharacterized protein [Drosophila kikkawai]|uniref:Uncharacterized protein n=1 Tax=Drosophila kikkawai TaxID=30033 RepID=A0A6P4J3Y9_DROKI|nr:uncharacterized protein LOC108080001 [Drosophila kikkawai]
MNPLPDFETLMINDSVIDDVIAKMSSVLEEATLQQLKQVWRSKMQKNLQVEPTDQVPNKDTETPDDTTKKDVKEEPVPLQQASDNVTNKSPKPIPVTGANPLGIKWALQEIELPPLQVRRTNRAIGHALQLDGGLAPIKEETSEEDDDEIEDELPQPEARGDDESLNSGDDPTGEDAVRDDAFESDNVIACQYNRVSHYCEKWKFEFQDGVMHLNGKDYVFKQMRGEANWFPGCFGSFTPPPPLFEDIDFHQCFTEPGEGQALEGGEYWKGDTQDETSGIGVSADDRHSSKAPPGVETLNWIVCRRQD